MSASLQSRWRLALVLFCVAVAGLLAAQVMLHGPMLEVDADVSLYFATHRHALLTQAMRWVSDLHQTSKLLVATALIALWRALRHDWHAVRALLVVPTGMLLNAGLKHAFQRARPNFSDPLVQIASYSFPSGHAAASTVFYGMLCALVFARTRSPIARGGAAVLSVAMVLLVTFSRVVLGAHYPSDVIAGIALGTVCVVVFLRFADPRPADQPSSSG